MSFIEQRVANLRFSVMSAEFACVFCTQTSASFSVNVGETYGCAYSDAFRTVIRF
jgi:hypothetical protein